MRAIAKGRFTPAFAIALLLEATIGAWLSDKALGAANPYARTNLVHTGPGRTIIYNKLDRIRLDRVKYDGLPLSEVIINLNSEAKRRDPEKRGINFIINPNAESATSTATPGAIDPATGLPVAPAAPSEPVDLNGLIIKINPALEDVRLADVLDAIIKVTQPPIKFSVEDYAVVFSLKGRDVAPLYVRTYKVDPNTFEQGLESVVGFVFANISTSSGGGGGGGTGAGGGGGITVPRVLVAGGTTGGGGAGQTGGGGQNVGIRGVTRTNAMEFVSLAARNYFAALGVNFVPGDGKNVYWKDRAGILVVRATLQDLDVIETAVQALNVAPPEINIKAKFVEVAQNDTRALGFDWYLGNVLMNNGTIAASGGTQRPFNGQPTAANPQGFFPGTSTATAFPSSPTDQLLTGGLRNTVNAPAAITPGGLAATKMGNDLILSFPTTSPDLYTVQTSPDLLHPWTDLQSGIQGDGTVKMVRITNAISADQGFYRLSIQKPASLLLPQSSAFAILGYSCGGIKEQSYLTGFDPTTGYPTGDVYLSTTCSTGGRGGGSHTYTAWAAVTWDLAGNVVSSAALSNAPTLNTNFIATDVYGDTIYNAGTKAYLVVPVPASPSGVTAVQSGDQFQVSWQPVAINPAAVTSSTVTASPVNSTASTLTTTVAGPAMTGVIPSLQPETTYQISVVNTSIGGSSPASAPISVTTVPASVPPSAPTGVTGHWTNLEPAGTNDTLVASWQAADPGNSPIDQYQVTIAGSDGAGTFMLMVSGTTASFTVDPTPNWSVTVQAHNDFGWGPSSSPIILGGL